MAKKFYSVKEAADLLGFSTNSIYKFLKEGRLGSFRGTSEQGRFRITRKDLEEFLGVPLKEVAPEALVEEPAQDEPGTRALEMEAELDEAGPKSILPLMVVRGLIIVGLILIIADLFVSRDFSLFQQILRLLLTGIIILITYQFGGVERQV